jgi:serine/threonine-protein phosphatase 2A activator
MPSSAVIMNMESQSKPERSKTSGCLEILDPTQAQAFIKPTKKIFEGRDVSRFLTSTAYRDIGTFVMQLSVSMCPKKDDVSGKVQKWGLDSSITLPEPVRKLQEMLQAIDAIIEEAPLDTGPRRFGNVSFRKWYAILESRVQDLLQTHLPAAVLNFESKSNGTSSMDEIAPYLLGSFGSAQRLDYGTGHELSFLAFLGCIWKLGGFSKERYDQEGSLERSIVIGIIEPYVFG